MGVSLITQITALRRVATSRPDQFIRAAIAVNAPQAQLLASQLASALRTLEFVASDERIRRCIEKTANQNVGISPTV